MQYIALFLACFFLVLALIGVILPGLPTVPFLLLAAWFSTKGSPRLNRWLHEQPYFGKILTDWESQTAVSRKSKIFAISMLIVSWGIMFSLLNIWVLAGITVLFIGVSAYLVSRPEPQ